MELPRKGQSLVERERPIEVRATSFEHYLSDKKLPPEQYVWVRATGPIPDDQACRLQFWPMHPT